MLLRLVGEGDVVLFEPEVPHWSRWWGQLAGSCGAAAPGGAVGGAVVDGVVAGGFVVDDV